MRKVNFSRRFYMRDVSAGTFCELLNLAQETSSYHRRQTFRRHLRRLDHHRQNWDFLQRSKLSENGTYKNFTVSLVKWPKRNSFSIDKF